MQIVVRELCYVDYIKEENMEQELTQDEELTAVRTVIYDSEKETLLEAFQEYVEDYDVHNVYKSRDDFDGECCGTAKILSVEEYGYEAKR